MKLLELGKQYAIVELDPGKFYGDGYVGAHAGYDNRETGDYAYAKNMLMDCDRGNARGWLWARLNGDIGILAIISLHDAAKLGVIETENEFGRISP